MNRFSLITGGIYFLNLAAVIALANGNRLIVVMITVIEVVQLVFAANAPVVTRPLWRSITVIVLTIAVVIFQYAVVLLRF